MSVLRLMLTLLLAILTFAGIGLAEDYTQWHLPEGAKVRLGKGSISEIAYSPDGRHLAIGGSIGIWIYDAKTGEDLNLLTGDTDGVESVTFSPDGRTLASGVRDDTIRLSDVRTGAHLRTLEGHIGPVYSVTLLT